MQYYILRCFFPVMSKWIDVSTHSTWDLADKAEHDFHLELGDYWKGNHKIRTKIHEITDRVVGTL